MAKKSCCYHKDGTQKSGSKKSSEFNYQTRNKKSFSERLKEARRKLGISQKDLAKQIGVSSTTIQNYESGQLPKGEHLASLSDVLGCTTDWLLLGIGPIKRDERAKEEKKVGAINEKQVECKVSKTADPLDKAISQAAQDLNISLDTEDKLIAKLLVKKGLRTLAKKALLSIQEMEGKTEKKEREKTKEDKQTKNNPGKTTIDLADIEPENGYLHRGLPGTLRQKR